MDYVTLASNVDSLKATLTELGEQAIMDKKLIGILHIACLIDIA